MQAMKITDGCMPQTVASLAAKGISLIVLLGLRLSHIIVILL